MQFDATLPRFDVLSALYRFPDGMILSELSRYLMVSNGNVTGIIYRLEGDGLVSEQPAMVIAVLSRSDYSGRQYLLPDMAAAHEEWVDELLSSIPARSRPP